jgi:hypothetical protein
LEPSTTCPPARLRLSDHSGRPRHVELLIARFPVSRPASLPGFDHRVDGENLRFSGEAPARTDSRPVITTGPAIGVAFTAIPGPVTTESARRTLSQGFRPGFVVNAGSLVCDVVGAILGLSGATIPLRHRAVSVILGLTDNVWSSTRSTMIRWGPSPPHRFSSASSSASSSAPGSLTGAQSRNLLHR